MTSRTGVILPYAIGDATQLSNQWLLCDGRAYANSEFPDLFPLLDHNTTHFVVPDLRSRLLVGLLKKSILIFQIGEGISTSNTTYPLHKTGGDSRVQLLEENMPAHNHFFFASDDDGSTSTLDGGFVAVGGVQPKMMFSTVLRFPLHNMTIGLSGGSQTHNNLMPSMGLNFIISTQENSK